MLRRNIRHNPATVGLQYSGYTRSMRPSQNSWCEVKWQQRRCSWPKQWQPCAGTAAALTQATILTKARTRHTTQSDLWFRFEDPQCPSTGRTLPSSPAPADQHRRHHHADKSDHSTTRDPSPRDRATRQRKRYCRSPDLTSGSDTEDDRTEAGTHETCARHHSPSAVRRHQNREDCTQ